MSLQNYNNHFYYNDITENKIEEMTIQITANGKKISRSMFSLESTYYNK